MMLAGYAQVGSHYQLGPESWTLAAAHRGYEYQDLLVALRLVDVMLGSIEQIYVDEKLILPNDRFDDLTTVDATARRERVQVKHTDRADQTPDVGDFHQ